MVSVSAEHAGLLQGFRAQPEGQDMESRSDGIRSGRILFALFCMWLVLWSASVVQDVVIWATGTGEKIWILDVDSEESFYTWFSTLLLGLAALLAFVLAAWRSGRGRSFPRQWGIIGAILLLLSMDEMLSFHERLSGMLSNAFSTSGIFEFAWVIPALVLVAAVGIVFLPFILRLPHRVARDIVLSGVIFVTGAVGMEMLAGLHVSESGGGAEVFASPTYRALTNIEEGLEGLGVLLLIRALLMQAQLYYPAFFGGAAAEPGRGGEAALSGR